MQSVTVQQVQEQLQSLGYDTVPDHIVQQVLAQGGRAGAHPARAAAHGSDCNASASADGSLRAGAHNSTGVAERQDQIRTQPACAARDTACTPHVWDPPTQPGHTAEVSTSRVLAPARPWHRPRRTAGPEGTGHLHSPSPSAGPSPHSSSRSQSSLGSSASPRSVLPRAVERHMGHASLHSMLAAPAAKPVVIDRVARFECAPCSTVEYGCSSQTHCQCMCVVLGSMCMHH